MPEDVDATEFVLQAAPLDETGGFNRVQSIGLDKVGLHLVQLEVLQVCQSYEDKRSGWVPFKQFAAILEDLTYRALTPSELLVPSL